MAQQANLEARIRVLEDIEAIDKLKSKYWRCVDKRLVDEIIGCFSENATADFGPLGKCEGRKKITDFFRGLPPVGDNKVGIHQGHNMEVDITSDATARGVGQVFTYGIDKAANRSRRTSAFFHDEYVKEKGEWKIANTKHNYVFREEFEREGISLPT